MMELKVLCPTCKGGTADFCGCPTCFDIGYTDPPQQVLDDLECAEIERELLKSKVGVSYYINPDNKEVFTIMLYPNKKQNITGRGRNKLESSSKLEVYRKAKAWLDEKDGE